MRNPDISMKILALFLLGAGLFCLCNKLPQYSFACGVLAIAAVALGKSVK